MRNYPPIAHIAIALAALLLLTAAFTFLPYRLPTPERLSPWVYLTAALLTLFGLILMRKEGRGLWVFVPFLLLCILGFLEETSYGVESGAVQPIYSETYNVDIYDVHNLLPILETALTKQLESIGLNFSMAASFLRVDGYLIAGLFIFCVALQFASRKQTELPRRVFRVLMLGLILATLAAIAWLLSLPAEARNSFAFGFSFSRLAIILAMLLSGVAAPALGLLAGSARAGAITAKISAALAANGPRRIAVAVLWILLLLGFGYQIWASLLNFTGQIAIVERVNPLVVWVTALCALALLSIAAWQGGMQAKLSSAGAKIRDLFAAYPLYIYAIVCILLVGFAQLMDQDRISLAQHIGFANPWDEEWNYWLEETFEMSGAFELLIATLVFFFGGAAAKASPVNEKR